MDGGKANPARARLNQHRLARPQRRGDLFVPARQHARDGVLEALGIRHIDPGIARVARQIELAPGLQRRRRNVETAAPDLDLVIAVLGRRLGLVEPGQAAVVALVEPPIADQFQVALASGLQRQFRRLGDGEQAARVARAQASERGREAGQARRGAAMVSSSRATNFST